MVKNTENAMKSTLASAIVIVLFFVTTLSAQQTVSIESANLLQGDQVLPLSGTVPGGRSGRIRAEIDLVSNRIDPATGAYLSPVLDAYWRVTAEGGQVVSPSQSTTHGWYGWRLEKDPLQILSFDETTGEATVRVAALLGLNADGCEYPLLSEGANTLEWVIGWVDTMFADDTTPPTGCEWQCSVTVDAAIGDVWVWITQLEIQHDQSVPVIVRLDSPAVSARTFSLTSGIDGLLAAGPYQVTVPAGEASAVVDIRTSVGAIGALTLTASENGQSVGSSNTANVSVGGETKFLEPGGLEEPHEGGGWNFPLYKRCVPPQAASGLPGSGQAHCGPCSNGTPAVPFCPDAAVIYTSGGCVRAFFASCFGGDTEDVMGTVYTLSGFVAYNCGVISNPGFTQTLSKICCIYQATGGTGTATAGSCH